MKELIEKKNPANNISWSPPIHTHANMRERERAIFPQLVPKFPGTSSPQPSTHSSPPPGQFSWLLCLWLHKLSYEQCFGPSGVAT